MQDEDFSEDDVLDIGTKLKKEKLREQNQEKVVKIKKEYKEEQEKSQENNQRNNNSFSIFKNKTALFLILIIFLAIGIHAYVASMPITEQWADEVVRANLKNQVRY